MKSLAQLCIILTLVIATASPWAHAQTSAPAPTVKAIMISGSVGLAGVAMKGLPADPQTDENGVYSAEVPLGFTGIVTPVKEGYKVEPPSRKYNNIQKDLKNENYVAIAKLLKISGNAGAPGVTMQGLPNRVVANSEGMYAAEVRYGWKGIVRPRRPGLFFEPPSRTYEAVTADQTEQNYTAQQGQMAGPAMVQDVLVIPTTGVNAVEFAETAEDMRVMLQILREKANEPRMVMGRSVLPDYGPLFGPSGRGPEAFYIQGYAAMFVMEVDFPLAAGPEPNVAGAQGQQREGDPVWQRAREKLAGSGQGGPPDTPSSLNLDQFKENLVRALRHAGNIRHLDPNERVILTVIEQNRPASLPGGGAAVYGPYGPGGRFGMQGGGYTYGGGSFSTDGSGGYTSYSTRGGGRVAGGAGPATSTTGNVLTIQAKKADIDAFAKDQISFDQFNQRVKVFSY